MLNVILFTIVFLWLFALTVWKANVTNWIQDLQRERLKVIKFIEDVKASSTPGHAGESAGGPQL